jgi:16S rRNA G966 N2-methylase RsmD
MARPQHQAAARRYDLIIADPPYAEFNDDVIERLVEHLSHAGVLAVSHTSKITPQLTGAVLIQHKVYGDTALSFYRAVT